MIYFIRNEESHHIKIGFSINPLERLLELQTGSSGKLSLLLTIPGNITHEHRLHKVFQHLRVREHGEWFDSLKNSRGILTPPENSLLHFIEEEKERQELGLIPRTWEDLWWSLTIEERMERIHKRLDEVRECYRGDDNGKKLLKRLKVLLVREGKRLSL